MADTPIQDRIAAKKRAAPNKRQRLLPVLVFLIFLCAMAGMVAASGYFGAQVGRQELELKRTATINALIGQRFNKGLQLMQEGNYALAQANLEEVLLYQQSNAGARAMLSTAIAAQTPTATPVVPTATPVIVDKGLLLRRAQQAADSADWAAVISLSDQLLALDNGYQRDTVDELRYQAFLTRGTERIRGAATEIEGGLFDLDQAEGIRALPNAIVGERRWASEYQTAIQYLGADWDRAIFLLSQLPQGYRDVARQLTDAYVNAGDAFANVGDWCQAEKKYGDALKAISSTRLETKRREAAQKCLSATPEAGGGLGAGTVVTSFTVLPASGISGRIAFSVYDATTGQYRPHAYDSALASVTALSNDFAGSSIYSPDNTRIVQSIYQDNAWQVIVKSSTDAVVIAQGTAPVWGPTGFIAYQGCSDTCGIHVINPDQPGSLRRLTSSSSDIAFKWSPQGDRVVYMSNFNGAWELYTAGLNGDFRQLTGLGSSSGAPAWSPDGAQIAFLSNRDGNFGLYVMNADGSNLQKVADFGGAIPAWQSDKSAWTR